MPTTIAHSSYQELSWNGRIINAVGRAHILQSSNLNCAVLEMDNIIIIEDEMTRGLKARITRDLHEPCGVEVEQI